MVSIVNFVELVVQQGGSLRAKKKRKAFLCLTLPYNKPFISGVGVEPQNTLFLKAERSSALRIVGIDAYKANCVQM